MSDFKQVQYKDFEDWWMLSGEWDVDKSINQSLEIINEVKEICEEAWRHGSSSTSKKNIDKSENDEIVERLKKYIESLENNIDQLYNIDKKCCDHAELETCENIRDHIVTQVLKSK